MNESTSIHKIGHIFANYGPILKIQNLAYSGVRARYDEPDDDVARDGDDVTRATWLWQRRILLWTWSMVTKHVAMDLSLEPRNGFW